MLLCWLLFARLLFRCLLFALLVLVVLLALVCSFWTFLPGIIFRILRATVLRGSSLCQSSLQHYWCRRRDVDLPSARPGDVGVGVGFCGSFPH